MSVMDKEIPVAFAGVDRLGTVPAWARRFDATRSTVSELGAAAKLPGLAVVQSSGPQKILAEADHLSKLFENFSLEANVASRLVFGFRKSEPEEFLELAPLLAQYPGLSGRVDLARQTADWRDTFLEAMTKVIATLEEKDPLVDVPAIAETSESLRAESGRLDANRVAGAFGVSVADLARQIGRTRQSVSKTPDAETLQPLLRPYERIARLRAVLEEAPFKAWLNTPNEHLEEEASPLDYIRAGAQGPLASFAENMLTGAPS